jgi:hypothetical protein
MKKKIAYITVCVIALLGIWAIMTVRALLNYFVAFEIIERKPSPSGKRDLILYTSDGGATTTRMMFVAITPHGDENYRDEQFLVLMLQHTYDVLLSWKNDDLVDIRLPSDIEESENRFQNTKRYDVRINYLEYDKRILEIDGTAVAP